MHKLNCTIKIHNYNLICFNYDFKKWKLLNSEGQGLKKIQIPTRNEDFQVHWICKYNHSDITWTKLMACQL